MTAIDRSSLIPHLRSVREYCAEVMEPEQVDEIGVRSYLEGNRLSRLAFWRKLSYVLHAAQLTPGGQVLDYGCGTGILLPSLVQNGRRVFATDVDLRPARFLVQQSGLTGINFLDIENWSSSLQQSSLDAIIAANVLEHVEDRLRLLGAFASHLKDTGRLVISGPTENLLYRFGRRLTGFSGSYHVANVSDVFRDAHAAGFRLIYRRRWPLPGMGCLYQIAAFARPSIPSHLPQRSHR